MADQTRFVVSALKYRPQTFTEIIGQDHITTTLRNAIRRGRLAHAYLFSGPRGVGKTSAARILTKAMNCEDIQDGEPCNKCEPCRTITGGRCLDAIELDAASNRGIDEVRDLRENVRFPPASCRYKVYIIDEAHQLTRDAFNALLKTLEEPPPHAKFILATTETEKMPDTILSRCQQYRFKPLSNDQIVGNLRQVLSNQPPGLFPKSIEEEILYLLARAADGGMRDAQSLFDQVASLADEDLTIEEVELVLGGVRLDTLVELVEAVRNRDTVTALEKVHEAYNRGQDMALLVRDLLGHFRNLLVAKTAPDRPDLIGLPGDQARVVSEQSANLSVEDALQSIDVLFEAERRLKVNASPRAVCEAALIKLAKMPTTLEIDALLSRKDIRLPGAVDGNPGPGSSSAPAPASLPNPPGATQESGRVKNPNPKTDSSAAVIAETKAEGLSHSSIIQMDEEPDQEVLETLLDSWDSICHKVSEKEVHVGGYLSDVTPQSFEGGRLDLTLPDVLTHHYKELNSDAAKNVIKEVLWKVLGAEVKEVQIRAVHESNKKASARKPGVKDLPANKEISSHDDILDAEPIVKTVLDRFDGVITEIKNNPNA